MAMGGQLGACSSAPSKMTEINQAMNDSSQINAVLLDRVNALGERLKAIRTAKPQQPSNAKDGISAPPCPLANEIRQRAVEVAQAVNTINILLEEIEL